MSDMILQVNHLSKSFGSHEVLRDIDFTVNKGDVTSIIGASGSGKSTLLRCINLLEIPVPVRFCTTVKMWSVVVSMLLPIAAVLAWCSSLSTCSTT